MKTITVNLYQFEELNPEAQKAALSKLADLNTTDKWWDYIYEDAEEVGFKITGFDLDRKVVNGHFMVSGEETAAAILDNHGEKCETYKLAAQYLEDLPDIRKSAPAAAQAEGIEYMSEEAFETKFLKRLSAAYVTILQADFDHLTSDETVKETIEANEYDFLENGTLYGKGGN